MLLPRNQRLNPANRSDGTLKRDSNNVRLFLLVLRNPFSVAKISLESPTDTVNYRSKLNPKINRNFEVFDPVDFLTIVSQHIPDQGVRMVRYCGLYSNKPRGYARKGTGRSKAAAKDARSWPKSSPPPSAKQPARKWRDLIRQPWHTDPLECPKCGKTLPLRGPGPM